MLQTPKPDSLGSTKATPHLRPIKKIDRTLQHDPSILCQNDGCAAESASNCFESTFKIFCRLHELSLYLIRKCFIFVDFLQKKCLIIQCSLLTMACSFSCSLNNIILLSFSSIFAGRRGLNIPGAPIKKQFSDASERESPMKRRPFSAINSTTSSNDVNPNGETIQKPVPPNDLSFATPSKTTSIIDDENMTPKSMPILVLPIPPTISVPMQTTTTAPALADAPIPFNVYQVQETAEQIDEYSFEERRAGFVLAETHSKPPMHV